MPKKQLGDGLAYVVVFGLLLVMVVAVAYGVQDGTTQPNHVGFEQHQTNLSQTGFEVFQLQNVGQGCIEDTETVFDPGTGREVTKPQNYSIVNYTGCWVNITKYRNSQQPQQPVSFSYKWNSLDTGSTAVMDWVTDVTDMYVVWLVPLALALLYILWSRTIKEGLQAGRGKT
jgi:hypothetical protein